MSHTLSITPEQFRHWLQDGQELAVIDLRDSSEFAKGAPLYATNLPSAQVDARLSDYIPRRAVRSVLVDAGNGEAQQIASRLREQGWEAVFALDGGIPAWNALGQGLPTFDTSGLDFSRHIRAERGTPALSAEQVQQALAAGETLHILDTRTLDEYAREHVPGAVAAPGAELLQHFNALVPDPQTTVVVSCAGLPRAILGAQTLIDAGVPNPVYYLDDGTAAWRRAGFSLEQGATRTYQAPLSDNDRQIAREQAERLEGAQAVPSIDLEQARAWQADPARTTYLLDVRSPQAYAAAHLPGSLSAEGGQLLAVSHRTLAVRGARVVLIDEVGGVRARTTAHWLSRRGFELALLEHDFSTAQA